MIRELAFASKQGMTAETLLWRGVIAVTIQDWVSKPLRPKHEAERYLFTNSRDLSLVCSSAGINVLKLRTCLNKVRGRTLLDLCRLLNSHGPNTERNVRPDVGRPTGQ